MLLRTLFVTIGLWAQFFIAFGQNDSLNNWQEQIISRIDADDFNESAYNRLMEMIGDLELNRRDTIFPTRIKQNIILRSDLCLNIREGFHNTTPEKIEQNKAYRGDYWNHSVRYKIQAGNEWSGGFVLNKDAGEPFQNHYPFFDSFNYYISYKPERKNMMVDRIIAGKYRVGLGAGLLLNQQFSLGKSVSQDMFMSGSATLSPHASTDEYNYMHGVAVELSRKHLRLLPFVSYKKIDAVVKNDTITSIPTDGMHRTNTEESKRDKASVMNAGLHASYAFKWAELGMNILYTRFSVPFVRPIRNYNTNYFRGQQLWQGSFDYHLRRFGFVLKGETAIDQNGNIATINQISHKLGEDWKASVIYRYLAQKYQQLYAATATESSSTQGENGVMMAFEGEPFAYWKVNCKFDYFFLGNINYGFDKPLHGFDLRTQVQYSKGSTTANISYRLKYKENLQHNLDLSLKVAVTDGINLKTQMRGKIYSSHKKGGYSLGYAIAQAVEWKRETSPLSAEIQCAWFDAKDYDCRLYISERNILYGFGLPMLYGQGIRANAVGTWKMSQNLTLDLKYSIFHYCNLNHISSGLQQIWGKNQQNLWLQLRVMI